MKDVLKILSMLLLISIVLGILFNQITSFEGKRVLFSFVFVLFFFILSKIFPLHSQSLYKMLKKVSIAFMFYLLSTFLSIILFPHVLMQNKSFQLVLSIFDVVIPSFGGHGTFIVLLPVWFIIWTPTTAVVLFITRRQNIVN
jgi:hypothetical protein